MQTIRAIVIKLGGIRPVGRASSLGWVRIANYSRRNLLPEDAFTAILALARRRKVPLSTADLLAANHREKQRRLKSKKALGNGSAKAVSRKGR